MRRRTRRRIQVPDQKQGSIGKLVQASPSFPSYPIIQRKADWAVVLLFHPSGSKPLSSPVLICLCNYIYERLDDHSLLQILLNKQVNTGSREHWIMQFSEKNHHIRFSSWNRNNPVQLTTVTTTGIQKKRWGWLEWKKIWRGLEWTFSYSWNIPFKQNGSELLWKRGKVFSLAVKGR